MTRYFLKTKKKNGHLIEFFLFLYMMMNMNFIHHQKSMFYQVQYRFLLIFLILHLIKYVLSSAELKKLKETYTAIFDININVIEVKRFVYIIFNNYYNF